MTMTIDDAATAVYKAIVEADDPAAAARRFGVTIEMALHDVSPGGVLVKYVRNHVVSTDRGAPGAGWVLIAIGEYGNDEVEWWPTERQAMAALQLVANKMGVTHTGSSTYIERHGRGARVQRVEKGWRKL